MVNSSALAWAIKLKKITIESGEILQCFFYDQNLKNIFKLLISIVNDNRKETGRNITTMVIINTTKLNQLIQHVKNRTTLPFIFINIIHP